MHITLRRQVNTYINMRGFIMRISFINNNKKNNVYCFFVFFLHILSFYSWEYNQHCLITYFEEIAHDK